MRLTVYLTDSNFTYDRAYDYTGSEAALPEGMTFTRGQFVYVPFGNGNRRSEAVIWEVCGDAEAAEQGKGKSRKLKEILGIEDCPPLTEAEMELCMELRKRYMCPPGLAAASLRPVRDRKGAGVNREIESAELAISREDAEAAVRETRLRSAGQLSIISRLLEQPEFKADTEMLLKNASANRSHLRALRDKGFIRLSKRPETPEEAMERVMRRPDTGKNRELLATYPPHELNPEQQAAYDLIKAGIGDGKLHKFLLHGITGSGKTEVYMHLIEYVRTLGLKTLVLVPEISLTPQMISHFTARFGENIAVWHSGLSDRERYREWHRMARGETDVAVATRSGIFAPMQPELIIIDEAHDGSYRSEETGIRYDTGEVAELRLRGGGTLVYASATPGTGLYRRAGQGDVQLVTLKGRAGGAQRPEVQVIDMRDGFTRGAGLAGSVFSPALKAALAENYGAGGQAMLFVGRRGYSSRLYCRDCGRTLKCHACGLPMTFHRGARRLLCNYCGHAAPAPEQCPACGSIYLGFGSPGTERVADELSALFPEAEVLRMDSDTVKGRDGHGEILARFSREKVPFLVGTQMITKGHDFPGVTLVAVIDADGQINQPEFDAGERAFQIFTQVSGRAGRGDKPGRVLIQTYNPDDPAVRCCVNADYETFSRGELAFREQLYYPPFCSLCSVRVSGTEDRRTYDFCRELAEKLKATAARQRAATAQNSETAARQRAGAAQNSETAARQRAAAAQNPDSAAGSPAPQKADRQPDSLLVLGPCREPIPKVADRYRWRINIKAENRAEITALLDEYYGKIGLRGDMRLSIVFEN